VTRFDTASSIYLSRLLTLDTSSALREEEKEKTKRECACACACMCICARVELCENSRPTSMRLGAIGVQCLTCVFSPIVATTATGVGKWDDGMLRVRARDLRVTVLALALFRGCYMLLLKRPGCLHLKLPVSVHCDLLFSVSLCRRL